MSLRPELRRLLRKELITKDITEEEGEELEELEMQHEKLYERIKKDVEEEARSGKEARWAAMTEVERAEVEAELRRLHRKHMVTKDSTAEEMQRRDALGDEYEALVQRIRKEVWETHLTEVRQAVAAAQAKADVLATSDTDAFKAASRYSDYEALLESVESGAVAPIRGSYLRKLRRRNGRLVRRQDLPPEATWTAAEVREVVELAMQKIPDRTMRNQLLGNMFLGLSYRWLGKGEPDGAGFHLNIIANFLDAYVGEEIVVNGKTEKGSRVDSPLRDLFVALGRCATRETTPSAEWFQESPLDCAIFWDYGSLWQKKPLDANGDQVDDRTPEMIKQFGEGLGASNIWYGHMWTITLVQPLLPNGFEALCQAEGRLCTTYAASGWCFVEASLSSLIKGNGFNGQNVRRIDIGKYSMGTSWGKPLMSEPVLQGAMASCASGTRPPPMLPSKMAAELENKSFFSRADVPQVARLYETFFDAVVPSQTELALGRLQWDAAEAAVVAAVLPRFQRVTVLDLSNNEIGVEGAKALVETLRVSSSLTELGLGFCEIGDEGAVAIATALKENAASKMAALGLYDNSIGVEGAKALAALCAASGSLTHLNLSGNKMGKEGKAALVEALRVNSSLTELLLQFCGIGDAGAVAIAMALKENAASKMATLDFHGNRIGIEGATALGTLCATSGSLRELIVSQNERMGKKGKAALRKAVKGREISRMAHLEGRNGVVLEF